MNRQGDVGSAEDGAPLAPECGDVSHGSHRAPWADWAARIRATGGQPVAQGNRRTATEDATCKAPGLSPELSELRDLSLICKGRHEIWLLPLGTARALPMDRRWDRARVAWFRQASLLRAKPPKGGDAEPRD